MKVGKPRTSPTNSSRCWHGNLLSSGIRGVLHTEFLLPKIKCLKLQLTGAPFKKSMASSCGTVVWLSRSLSKPELPFILSVPYSVSRDSQVVQDHSEKDSCKNNHKKNTETAVRCLRKDIRWQIQSSVTTDAGRNKNCLPSHPGIQFLLLFILTKLYLYYRVCQVYPSWHLPRLLCLHKTYI